MKKLQYYRRLLVTAFGFTLFGLGGMLSGITVFPIIYLLPISLATKRNFSRDVIRLMFRFFINAMRFLGVLTYEFKNETQLRKAENQLIIANHPTLLDVVFIMSVARRPSCVIKRGVWYNPFMFFVVRAAGFIQNSSDPEIILERCAKVLENGESLVIFPEGTRTVPGKEMTLKRGAAQIALKAQKDFLPILISCIPISLSKRHKWYHIPKEGPMHFTFWTQNKIALSTIDGSNGKKTLAARAITQYLQGFFTNRIVADGSIRARN